MSTAPIPFSLTAVTSHPSSTKALRGFEGEEGGRRGDEKVGWMCSCPPSTLSVDLTIPMLVLFNYISKIRSEEHQEPSKSVDPRLP